MLYKTWENGHLHLIPDFWGNDADLSSFMIKVIIGLSCVAFESFFFTAFIRKECWTSLKFFSPPAEVIMWSFSYMYFCNELRNLQCDRLRHGVGLSYCISWAGISRVHWAFPCLCTFRRLVIFTLGLQYLCVLCPHGMATICCSIYKRYFLLYSDTS